MLKKFQNGGIMADIFTRFKNAINVFRRGPDPPNLDLGPSSSYRLDRPTVRFSGAEKTIINAIYNRFAVDSASNSIKHVKIDKNGRYLETINDSLNDCFTLEANTDQSGRAFFQDLIESMLQEGVVAVVPVDTGSSSVWDDSDSMTIYTLRVGKIVEWYPAAVKVNLYNERDGKHHDIIVPKKSTAIIYNPFYTVMNSPNSIYPRLIRKLNLMDSVDEMSGSGKLDLIFQLPFALKGAIKKKEAEKRKRELEEQLSKSQYGIGYIDATEHVTQLNRSVESQVLKHTEYITSMLFNQLGITSAILDGSADGQQLVNYNNRIIEPILSAITMEFNRKFLSKTARTRGHAIMFFSDPFRLIPVLSLAEMADKLIRNQILSANEFRQILGRIPSDDPRADELRNPNINQSNEEVQQFYDNDQYDQTTE